jgi:hypothetical protein
MSQALPLLISLIEEERNSSDTTKKKARNIGKKNRVPCNQFTLVEPIGKSRMVAQNYQSFGQRHTPTIQQLC